VFRKSQGHPGNPKIQMKTLDATHFEPYFEPALSVNRGYQREFLNSLQ